MSTSTDAARPMMMVRTDADLVEEELSLPSPKPLGHFITPVHDREFALVSRRMAKVCYFASIDLAIPFMRMLYRERVRPSGNGGGERLEGGLDFRLYMYDRATCCWLVAVRHIEVPATEEEVLCAR